MKQVAHTPGPWFYDGPSPSTEAYIVHVADGEIAQVFAGGEYAYDQSEDESNAKCNANALLIAAAPELLAKLKSLAEAAMNVNDYGKQRHHNAMEAAINEAIITIANAEGNS